ncbi:putative zinc finger in N-recognin-domain-containing protein, partial [Blastocladiella britannica]
CGRRLRVNDLVYRCATCGADPTCVLCAGCFATQDHAGHDVYVHASSGSGCCDCGDPDAWRRELHC